MRDHYGREINYLRLSITDRCNLRCLYCMPSGMPAPKLPMGELLTYEELLAVARAAVRLGITRFKVTGGEPLVRRGATELIAQLKAVPGVDQVTLTTNGVLLEEAVPALVQAGLDGVNVSLDTLRPQVYRQITGTDALPAVQAGIRAALQAGLRVKVNAVLLEGINAGEWRELAELTRDDPLDVRFIELMPIGHGRDCPGVSNARVLARLQEAWPELTEDRTVHGNGPARYLRLPGHRGSVGLIGAVHERFCDRCNRLRLTSTGELRPCLCYGAAADLRPEGRPCPWDGSDPGRERRIEEALAGELARAIAQKPAQHCFEDPQKMTNTLPMAGIGG